MIFWEEEQYYQFFVGWFQTSPSHVTNTGETEALQHPLLLLRNKAMHSRKGTQVFGNKSLEVTGM